MKLADLAAVEALAGERDMLKQHMVGEIVVTIGGWTMQPRFVRAVAGGIRLEIRNRITDIDAKLADLGVQVRESEPKPSAGSHGQGRRARPTTASADAPAKGTGSDA